MAHLVHSDSVYRVEPGKGPDYDSDNPLLRLLGLIEQTRLAAGRECYEAQSLQYLFPLTWLELYGPTAPNSDDLDPATQDLKTDFQKQNIRDFRLGDTRAVRGWASLGAWRGPFLQLSYRAGPDSALAGRAGALPEAIGCTISAAGRPARLSLRVPYDPASGRYVVEIWGHNGDGLRDQLDTLGRDALDAGRLLARPDIVAGDADDFERAAVDGQDLRGIAPGHCMHPVLPLHLDIHWTALPDGTGAADPAEGTMRLGFEMAVRGWTNYLSVGTSGNPHGGVGFLEYRTLFSEYGRYANSGELSRTLEPWNLDAFDNRPGSGQEPFMAVDYMDLHVLDPGCGIGLHRHRDNSEAFLMLEGEGLMVVGDWADSGTRVRSFEVRSLLPGHLALLKGGNLHALANPSDARAQLFMFGGYD